MFYAHDPLYHGSNVLGYLTTVPIQWSNQFRMSELIFN